MSHSRKDGRHRGGHPNTQNKEVWSKRCAKVNMWAHHAPRAGLSYKTITHRHERRAARRDIDREVQEL